MLDPKQWTRDEIERHSADMRQFIDFREATLENGMRVVEAYNSSGLHFTILPDRGLDIWTAWYNGLPLTWAALGSPKPADNADSWLRQFPGGLLATCGLTHAGPPETDAETGEVRDLHGRYNRLPARSMANEWLGWGDDGKFRLTLRAMIAEAALFGEQLRLIRTYTLTLGEPTIDIHDVVTNIGDTPAPLMILYHFNVGYPLVAQGAKLTTPHAAVHPRNDDARRGIDRWADYDAAAPGYAEQVFFHHVKADANGMAEAALHHADFGLSFKWQTDSLPYLTQWKNTRQNIYVCGVEPGNCIPEGQNAAKASGRLQTLQPGETQTFHNALSVLDGKDAVDAAVARIDGLRSSGATVAADFSGYAE